MTHVGRARGAHGAKTSLTTSYDASNKVASAEALADSGCNRIAPSPARGWERGREKKGGGRGREAEEEGERGRTGHTVEPSSRHSARFSAALPSPRLTSWKSCCRAASSPATPTRHMKHGSQLTGPLLHSPRAACRLPRRHFRQQQRVKHT